MQTQTLVFAPAFRSSTHGPKLKDQGQVQHGDYLRQYGSDFGREAHPLEAQEAGHDPHSIGGVIVTIRPKYEAQPNPTRSEETTAYELVTLRDLDTCQRCRRNCGWGVTSRDHRKDRSVGGLTVVSNLQVLGGTGTTGCHGWKCAHPRDAVFEGWAVPSWADPHEWPARRWVSDEFGRLRLAWVLYDDLGGFREISEREARERMEGVA